MDGEDEEESAMAGTVDLLSMLSPEIMDSFTPEQRAALWAASRAISWKRHPVNMRLAAVIPFGPRLFMTIVGGAERRSNVRQYRERRSFPFLTVGNVSFLCGALAISLIIAAGLLHLGQVMGHG